MKIQFDDSKAQTYLKKGLCRVYTFEVDGESVTFDWGWEQKIAKSGVILVSIKINADGTPALDAKGNPQPFGAPWGNAQQEYDDNYEQVPGAPEGVVRKKAKIRAYQPGVEFTTDGTTTKDGNKEVEEHIGGAEDWIVRTEGAADDDIYVIKGDKFKELEYVLA